MSMTTGISNDLRAYAQIIKDTSDETLDLTCVKIIMREAADTIEELSAKLHAANMERPSQYYHGGWIPCEERLPNKDGVYIVTEHIYSLSDKNHNGVPRIKVEQVEFESGKWKRNSFFEVIAWQPLPQPYKAKSEV